MPGFIGNFINQRRYGDPLVIVSGLPRSGTSMMMKMLESGGLPIMTDAVRTADIDNPKGYYEFERVKDLEKEKDKSYLREGRGKVLKVISFLLKDLPDDNRYKVIFMRRDLHEVIASQNKMIKHRGEQDDTNDKMMIEAYLNHLAAVRILVRKRPNFEMVEVRYDTAVHAPKDAARQVNAFLGGTLDEAKMGEVIDADLYRNRKGATV
ncbi:MAG: sulfotransferase domain-containing protein [Pseudomonadota bacterium]|nr:sulfotransferase domain-containing protein [Pseudomonadota bacterium]